MNQNHCKPREARFARVLGCFLFAWFVPALHLPAAASAVSFSHDIQPLLEQYCYKCHGAAKPKAGVNLEQFKDDTSVWRDPRLWETVVSQLRESAMPPDGKPQPSDPERERLTGWVAAKLDSLDRGDVPRDPGRVLIHRLSRFEYNNTIRDLFGVASRPADKFPADGGGGAGFDNNASTLFIPPILMEKLLAPPMKSWPKLPRTKSSSPKPAAWFPAGGPPGRLPIILFFTFFAARPSARKRIGSLRSTTRY